MHPSESDSINEYIHDIYRLRCQSSRFSASDLGHLNGIELLLGHNCPERMLVPDNFLQVLDSLVLRPAAR